MAAIAGIAMIVIASLSPGNGTSGSLGVALLGASAFFMPAWPVTNFYHTVTKRSRIWLSDLSRALELLRRTDGEKSGGETILATLSNMFPVYDYDVKESLTRRLVAALPHMTPEQRQAFLAVAREMIEHNSSLRSLTDLTRADGAVQSAAERSDLFEAKMRGVSRHGDHFPAEGYVLASWLNSLGALPPDERKARVARLPQFMEMTSLKALFASPPAYSTLEYSTPSEYKGVSLFEWCLDLLSADAGPEAADRALDLCLRRLRGGGDHRDLIEGRDIDLRTLSAARTCFLRHGKGRGLTPRLAQLYRQIADQMSRLPETTTFIVYDTVERNQDGAQWLSSKQPPRIVAARLNRWAGELEGAVLPPMTQAMLIEEYFGIKLTVTRHEGHETAEIYQDGKRLGIVDSVTSYGEESFSGNNLYRAVRKFMRESAE